MFLLACDVFVIRSHHTHARLSLSLSLSLSRDPSVSLSLSCVCRPCLCVLVSVHVSPRSSLLDTSCSHMHILSRTYAQCYLTSFSSSPTYIHIHIHTHTHTHPHRIMIFPCIAIAVLLTIPFLPATYAQVAENDAIAATDPSLITPCWTHPPIPTECKHARIHTQQHAST